MFTISSPQIVEKVGGFEKNAKELRPTGQKPVHAIGFFEQGIFLGLGITAAIVLPTLGYVVFRTVKETWRLWKRT